VTAIVVQRASAGDGRTAPGRRWRHEHGFTLIELLVVVVFIGILAAIAIPSFLNQRSKAHDAGAKVVARTAETAIEAFAAQNDGSYSGATPAALKSIEPSLITASSSQAYLARLDVTGRTGYVLVASSPMSGASFTVSAHAGDVTRTCSGDNGGCADGTW
jgi:type IV pilus assembly protein PilA